ncbi:hypothetical protein BCR33DRAFT_717631 [Rhizoclosmatium globosum]|uniref:Uncharacterized protein n=1 Tax=Rhizoclosmatium globosum TaxID=329046 RepID=A0A1Y2C925_9FUNG|nr:hypothetical protein BCR33DRAFT_717631 [Rhizoclosmatium globosum]|eukprot:ORY43417.1 hypothetical protein BCR33DRAFT_717631 [Rhizoclosmatium globosum]
MYRFLMAACILMLVILVFFILSGRRGKPLTFQSIATPFNVSLLILIFSITIVFAIEAETYQLPTGEELVDAPAQYNILTSIKLVFLSTGEASYIYYCYKRAGQLGIRVFPHWFPFLQTATWTAPIIILGQAIPNAIEAALKLTYLSSETTEHQLELATVCMCALSAALVLTLDTLLLSIFYKYIRDSLYAATTTDRKFIIIAKYGMVAIGTSYIAFGFYISFAVFMLDFLLLVSMGLMGLLAMILFAMKIALHANDVKDEQEGGRVMSTDELKRSIAESRKHMEASIEGLNVLSLDSPPMPMKGESVRKKQDSASPH